MDNDKCERNYRAEVDKLNCQIKAVSDETELLRCKCEALERENIKLRAIRNTVEVIFGREFFE